MPEIRADYHLAEPGWAITAEFSAEPKADDFRRRTAYGEEVTRRFYLEAGAQRFMVARFFYPVVPQASERDALYRESVGTMMTSRPGVIRAAGNFTLGNYAGFRVVIAQTREHTVREVRQVLIGASLYVVSAEWPEPPGMAPADAEGPRAPEIERFLRAVAVRPEFANRRGVEEAERWRLIRVGSFSVRFDGTRWYRDPADDEPGVINLLRVDKLAEAQFIVEPERLPSPGMEEVVLATARENAESVALRRRGRKNHGGVDVEELEFTARADGNTYVNHGYYYTGPAGAVQLRGWAREQDYARMAGDISELLDGLQVVGRGADSAAAQSSH
jgi:hypothetical protein